MFKRTIKRFTTLMLAVMMVISLIPLSAFEVAAASSVLSGTLGVEGVEAIPADAYGTWEAEGDTITGSVTGTNKSGSGCSATSAASKTTTLTIKNKKSGDAELSFSYLYTPNANKGTAKINGTEVTGDGTFSTVLASGASITVELYSGDVSGDKGAFTTQITLEGISLVMDTTPAVSFQKVDGGSYTVDGEAVTADTVKSKSSKEEYVLTATADSAHSFYGWYKDDGVLLSKDATYHAKFDSEATIYPHFRTADEPVLGVGERTFFDWQ